MDRAASHRRSLMKFVLAAYLSVCVFPTSLLADQGPVLSNTPAHTVTITEMFAFLFLMLGPIKILGPFVQLTRKGDGAFAKRLTFRAFLYSCAALVFAAVIGHHLPNYNSLGSRPITKSRQPSFIVVEIFDAPEDCAPSLSHYRACHRSRSRSGLPLLLRS